MNDSQKWWMFSFLFDSVTLSTSKHPEDKIQNVVGTHTKQLDAYATYSCNKECSQCVTFNQVVISF